MTLSYASGATRPDALITVTDSAGNPVDLSADTLTLRVGSASVEAFAKTAGLTLTGNVVHVVWSTASEITTLKPGNYRCDLLSTDTGGKVRKFGGRLTITPAVP